MLRVNFYPNGEIADERLRFAVIAARQDGEWIFCRHRLRETWEMPGGHREPGESIEQTARRELSEETGAKVFSMSLVSLYGVEKEVGSADERRKLSAISKRSQRAAECRGMAETEGEETFGALFIAEVQELGPLNPAFEIGEIRLSCAFPKDWTYPEIQPPLMHQVQGWLNLQTSSDELWDVLDEQGRPTGKLHRRGDPMGPGEYHLCVNAWVVNSRGEFLLTQRAANKGYSHLWESTGGSAVAGDDSLTAALRELKEETGLVAHPENGRMLFRRQGPGWIGDIWLFREDFNLDEIVFQPGETCGAQCATPERIMEMQRDGEMVTYAYLPRLFEEAAKEQ